MARVFLAGSGMFGSLVAQAAVDDGHQIVGVSAPESGRGREGAPDLTSLWAWRFDVPFTSQRSLRPDAIPDGTDVIVTAHSHAFIGRLTRARAAVAVGYHPSLLPLHRGRDAVRWQSRMGERVVGGTIYHLTDRVDGGPIADQRHLIVPPGLPAGELWREHLSPLGVSMVRDILHSVDAGTVAYVPQDDSLATWEPSFSAEPIYRPELLAIGGPRRGGGGGV